MPRVLGIDPGTISFDVCGLDDGRVFLTESLPTTDFNRSPERLVEILRRALPLELVAGPSGYGLPLIPIEKVGERELEALWLSRPGEGGQIGGLRRLVALLRDASFNVIFTPGVIHLPTVPAHRKINRIDLGTADKVCAAALGIFDQARRLNIAFEETSFLLVELGGAFSAVLAVEKGAIVSGVGGTSGPMGYLSSGAWDGEVAVFLGELKKEMLFTGGMAFVVGEPHAPPEALASRTDRVACVAKEAFVEGLLKAVAAEAAVLSHCREILLSGRLSRLADFREPVGAALARFAPVRDLTLARAPKEAALGAALIADGLCGGECRRLVDVMRLRESAGSALDHLYVKDAGRWSGS